MTHHYACQCTSKHSVGDGDFSDRSNLLLRIPTLLNCHAGNRLRFSPVSHDIHNDKPLRHGYIHFQENYSILKPARQYQLIRVITLQVARPYQTVIAHITRWACWSASCNTPPFNLYLLYHEKSTHYKCFFLK